MFQAMSSGVRITVLMYCILFVYFLNVLYEWWTLHAASILSYRYSLEYCSSRLSRLTSRIGCHFGFFSMDPLKMDVPRTCSSCKRDDEGLVWLDCNLAYVVTRLLPGRSGVWFPAWERSFFFPSQKVWIHLACFYSGGGRGWPLTKV